MSDLTTMDKIFKLMLEEAAAREDLSTELNLLMICLEILDKFRDITEDQNLGLIQYGQGIKWRLKQCDPKKSY